MQSRVQNSAKVGARTRNLALMQGSVKLLSPSKLGEHCVERLFELCRQEDKLRGRCWPPLADSEAPNAACDMLRPGYLLAI